MQIPSPLLSLHLVAKTGAATPRQLVALQHGVASPMVSISATRRMHQRLRRLAAKGWVRLTEIQSSSRVLRSTETWCYRLTDAGRLAAPRLEGEELSAVRAVVAAAAEADLDGWAPEPDVQARSPWATWKRHHVRHRLHQAVQAGWLERQWEGRRGRHTIATLEPAGEARLAAWMRQYGHRHTPPTRPPRLDAVVHHLLVIEAATRELSGRQAKFLRLLGDESLRSLSRKGRRLTAGRSDVPLPDGRLRMQEPDQPTATWLDIEILVSKYTDTMILDKCRELDLTTTAFYVPTKRLQARCSRLTGVVPHLL